MAEGVVLQILLSGVILGALYSMMAAGLSLVWSTLGIFNFAHGVLMTVAAYVAWTVGTSEVVGLGPFAGLVAGLAASILIGLAINLVLVRPFQTQKDAIQLVVITTLAASIMLENLSLIAWGGQIKKMPPLIDGTISGFGVAISAHEAIILVAAPLLLIALAIFLGRSKYGRAIRALGQNAEAAQLVGIDARVIYAVVFALSATLAAMAGILLGSIRFITPTMGSEPLMKAMIVSIFGGLGSLSGTVAAAFAIGLIEALLTYVVGLYWTPSLLFLVMIAVLMIRPTGLVKA